MKTFTYIGRSAILLAIVSLAFSSCRRDDENRQPDPEPNEEFQKINNWIYDTMQEVYLWTEFLPSRPNLNLNPQEFFQRLLYEEDRFSILAEDVDEFMLGLSGVNQDAGYELQFARTENDNQVVAIILYTKENSPARNLGLRRGDLITRVNNARISSSNINAVLEALSSPHTIHWARFNDDTQEFEDQGTLNVNVTQVTENPNFLDSIYDYNGKKIGYYVYHFFTPGTNGEEYNNQMDEIFQRFKSEGVSEVIVDLRYNSGGAVPAAVNLGSLLGKGVDETQLFFHNQWNNLYQQAFEEIAQNGGPDNIRQNFRNKPENIGNNLSSGRVYILTGHQTASASELIINGLKPYMDVYLTGDETIGKNIGSIPIEDEDNPNNNLVLVPEVFIIFNSRDETYPEGFTPNTLINEFEHLPLREFGDTRDPLLNHVLSTIDGTLARRAPLTTGLKAKPILSTIDKKTRTNRTIFTPEK
jgi:carboxyl-terminal processing protease